MLPLAISWAMRPIGLLWVRGFALAISFWPCDGQRCRFFWPSHGLRVASVPLPTAPRKVGKWGGLGGKWGNYPRHWGNHRPRCDRSCATCATLRHLPIATWRTHKPLSPNELWRLAPGAPAPRHFFLVFFFFSPPHPSPFSLFYTT
jgi:hypothetical protein